ncbi:MAG: ABC transporter ATP-binding protein [Eubacteriales bacterium]
MPDIVLNDLTKIYKDVPALDSISMEVADGEFMVLVGHSGCGKTTLLRLLSGLIQPDRGSIRIAGNDVTCVKAEKRDVVLVFQESLLFPHLTVEDNIAFGLKMQGCSQKKRKQKAQELLKLMQLPDIGRRYPAQLSGGQQQRVALARALALEPKVMLLDEPLANLDPRLRDDLRELIVKLHKKFRMTTIMVTHDQNEAMVMADRIAVLMDGKLLQIDKPYDIYNKPTSRDVAALFGQCNFITGYLEDGVFDTNGYRFTVSALKKPGRVEACIRTEHIKLVRPEKNMPTGVVEDKKYVGGQSLFKVNIGSLSILAKANNFDFYTGMKVGLRIDWSQVFFSSLESGK